MRFPWTTFSTHRSSRRRCANWRPNPVATSSELHDEALSDLDEMATKPGRMTVAGWDRFCTWLARAYKLDYVPEEVHRLKEMNRDSALIFLPNHRSYLDPLVLRSALQQHGFPPNNVLGGANLAIWPMNHVGRRNGIVFIRREFRDDHLYRAVLKRYLAYLIEHRQNLEWYIEGGRTRTGKLRPPRYGILSYVVDAYAEYPQHDVRIVPTSIIYDQQHEVGAISAEEMGGAKKAESIGWLFDFAKSQSRRLGRAHLRFGEPLSLRDALSLTLDDEGHPRPRLAVPKVAFEVADRVNTVTPVTPSALVTFALLDNGDRAITVPEGRVILEPLLAYINLRKLPVTSKFELADHGPLRDALDTLVRENVVSKFSGGVESVYMVELAHQHEAAFYRNTIIHHFINRAITELALLEAAESGNPDITGSTWRYARRLKEILKFEFFFPTTRKFAEQIAAEAEIVYPGWQDDTWTAAGVMAEFREVKLHLAHRVVGPFLEAYSVLADELEKYDPAVEVDESDLVERCLGLAQQHWLQKTLHTPESISRDYFRNAFKLAENQGLIKTDEPDLAVRRAAFADELRDLVRRVDEIRLLALESGQPLMTERAVPTGGPRG